MTVTLYGSVTVTLPNGWKVKPHPGSTSAVFSDGKAFFEVHSPNPKAKNAEDIASYALGTITPGASILSKGNEKISGFDAAYYIVSKGGTKIRITGLDAKTRLTLVERAPSGSYDSYKQIFEKIRNGIRFL